MLLLKRLLPAGLILAGCLLAAPERCAAQDNEERFTLSVQGIQLNELLEMLALKHRISIVCSSDVKGVVSVNLFDVTLDEALESILEVNGLSFTRRGSIIHVTRPEVVKTAPASRAFQLNWADPARMYTLLDELKSESGRVVRSEDSNAIIVRDSLEVVEEMASIVELLDVKPRQVLITTWVMELSDSDLTQMGINWANLNNLKIFDFSNEFGFSRSSEHTHDGTASGKVFSSSKLTSVDLRAGVLAENEFNLLLGFFETLSQSKVVSEPRVMTMENRPATIVVGTIVPIPLYDFSEVGTRILSGFQEQRVGTQLIVTPRVHTDGYITLDINPRVEAITDYIMVDGERQRPIVSTRQAETTVMVRSGDTIVIGGLRDESRSMQGGQVPYLHSLPLIGGLFRNKSNDTRVTDLTIFIRPEIFDEERPLSAEERMIFDAYERKPLTGPKEQ